MFGVLAVLVVLAASILFILHVKWEYSTFVRTLDHIPGPPKVPFFGNLLGLPRETDELLSIIQGKWIETYGRIFRVWVGFQSFVDISSPPLMESILTSQKFIDKGNTYDILHPWLGDGLLLAAGEKWKKSRRLLTPAFHFQILDNFFDVFNRNAEILAGQLRQFIEKNSDNEVDVYPLIKRCTLDIICETAMGIQVNAQLEDSDYIKAVQSLTETLIVRFMSPLRVLPDWIFRLTPIGRQYTKSLTKVHDFTMKVIRERKEDINVETEILDEKLTEETSMGIGKKRRAFLDLMLIAAKEGADLSDTDIRNEVDTFMFEGHDTTASAAVWFLYCIANHPQHQESIQAELDHVFEGSSRPCTMEDVPKLKFLECCIKESMRLYPSVPNVKRFISHDTELGGYKIPAGASISLHIYGLHRNPEAFPDPLAFKPERFFSDQKVDRHPFAFVPFSAGPRNCIGQRFAMLEEKVLLSTLLRQFTFHFKPDREPAKICADLVLKPKDGMPLIITPRKVT